MSYLVARMEKMKKQNLGGIQRHNQREFKNHSNKEIDMERSHLNYDLVNQENIKYQDKIMKIIDEQRESKRAVRKDAVLVNEWIITSDKDFFKDMDPDKTRDFFETAAAFFEERYGKQNLAYAQVHLDETTPHMHLGVVPMKDGRLSSKDIFTRKELLAIQEEMPRFMREKGFEVNRGEEKSDKKHLTVPEYKDMQRRIAEMAREERELTERVNTLKEHENVSERLLEAQKDYLKQSEARPPKIIGGQRMAKVNGKEVPVYTVPASEMSRLDAIRKSAGAVLAENKRLENENEHLKGRIKVLTRAQLKMADLLKTAQKHASRFADGVFERAITYAKQFTKNNSPGVQQVQDRMLENVKESSAGMKDYRDWEERKRNMQKKILHNDREL